MSSPLLPYANAFLVIDATGLPTVENGRVVVTQAARYLIQCYLTRQDSTGVTTGADYLPTLGGQGNNLPGSSGVVYLYRGYGLRYVEVEDDHELGVDEVPSSGWVELVSSSRPGWLMAGIQVQHLQGDEPIKVSTLERVTGKFGGSNIDATISVNIQGIPLILRSGDVVG